MKASQLTRILAGGALAMLAFVMAGCSSGSTSNDQADEAASAGDGAATADAPTVTILQPTPNQEFKTTDTITLVGTGVDAVDGDLAKAADAKERMLWSTSIPDRSEINPAGEGPSDTMGAGTDHPSVPGTFIVHFDVTNTRGKTGSATVTIVIK
jgi:hypothetical protein